MLCALRNQVAPYENEKGAADKMVDLWVTRLGRVLLAGKGYTAKEMKHTFPLIAADFANIPVTRVPKVKVGVVGEIYVKYSPLGNNDLQKFLESQDCEVNFPGLMGFVQYCAFNMGEDHILYGGKLADKGHGVEPLTHIRPIYCVQAVCLCLLAFASLLAVGATTLLRPYVER